MKQLKSGAAASFSEKQQKKIVTWSHVARSGLLQVARAFLYDPKDSFPATEVICFPQPPCCGQGKDAELLSSPAVHAVFTPPAPNQPRAST